MQLHFITLLAPSDFVIMMTIQGDRVKCVVCKTII